MLYVWHVTVEADTKASAPEERKVPIRKGTITKLEIFMAEGCHGMVHGTISHRLTQMLPFNTDEAVRSNGYSVPGEYRWPVTETEPELILRAWSPDTSYDHEVTFRANILPEEEVSLGPLTRLMTRILKLITGVG